MQDVITIDGSLFEGGGQMIRSSLALSLILNKEFNMHSIRKSRPNPGINNQLRSVFSAFIEKVPKVGDTQIFFYPRFLKPKQIKAGTAASCTLMMQCFVPVFALLHYEQAVKINGGTDVGMSPPIESINLGLIPLLQLMGVHLEILDYEPGYYPTGKGHIVVKVTSGENILPMTRVTVGKPKKVVITYYIKDDEVPAKAKELKRQIQRLLNAFFKEELKILFEIKTHRVSKTKDEYGIGCIVLGQGLVWDIGTVGSKVSEEQIIKRLIQYGEEKPCFDQHHQDQLLIFAALAHGTSSFFVGANLTLHTKSLIYVLQSFIPHFKYTFQDGILSIHGISFKRQFNQ